MCVTHHTTFVSLELEHGNVVFRLLEHMPHELRTAIRTVQRFEMYEAM